MTMLSVNVNKIALLRNSRGQDTPGVVDFADHCIRLGVRGITVHPRPDQRHITREDVGSLSRFLKLHPEVEFNIEGYPTPEFLALVIEAAPAQCTLVPDAPEQLTSDHGWNVADNRDLLAQALKQLRKAGIRGSLFVDPGAENLEMIRELGGDRVELYTEQYARHFGLESEDEVWQRYADTARLATEAGLGLNAGHDLNLRNLARFLEIPDILEVSIGHALVVECLYQGLESVIEQYLAITARV